MTDAPQAKPDGHRKTPLLKPVSPVLLMRERIAKPTPSSIPAKAGIR